MSNTTDHVLKITVPAVARFALKYAAIKTAFIYVEKCHKDYAIKKYSL